MAARSEPEPDSVYFYVGDVLWYVVGPYEGYKARLSMMVVSFDLGSSARVEWRSTDEVSFEMLLGFLMHAAMTTPERTHVR
jgi:hypothetical protein